MQFKYGIIFTIQWLKFLFFPATVKAGYMFKSAETYKAALIKSLNFTTLFINTFYSFIIQCIELLTPRTLQQTNKELGTDS